MIKTLNRTLKQDRERFTLPKNVQDIIPVQSVYPDGIFQTGKNKFSKTFRFEDINYYVASSEDKKAMFLGYSEILNALDSTAVTKLTINNRRLNRADFKRKVLIGMKGDSLDIYRKEYDDMLSGKAADANSIVQEKYITITVTRKDIEEARTYFRRAGAELMAHFSQMGSDCTELDPKERLRIIYDFYRAGEETSFHFDFKDRMRKGHDFRDYICPDCFENERDHFRIGDRYGRVLFLKDYASFIKDSMVADLTELDRDMMLSIVHTADTKEALDNDTEALLTTARQNLCQLSVLRWQQLDGLKTVLPFGVRKIDSFRTLTTESLAVFMPFRVQEVHDEHGIYYGQNVISKNMIIADRRQLLNGNSFILGVSGSGKSFAGKNEIVNLMLSSDADIIVVDPEREYSPLVRALGGEVIEISAASPNHINAMDMSKEYGEVDPIIEKSQFLQSLCEQIIAGHRFAKGQQSIIDRCTENVYRFYKQGDYRGEPSTLQDFRSELLRQPEPEAHSLALELELFTRGSLNTFAKQTNVDTKNRLICYDILELGEQLRAIGMLVILDSILNRIIANRKKGRQTFVFIDEIYILFMHEYSAQFLFKLWKRVRKYGAYCTGLTQNVEDLLQSHTARTMLSNSEFIIMLNQAATDRDELAKLLNISDQQLSFIKNVSAGCGLIKVGSSLVPFENNFPKNTKLYRLMTTKPNDDFR